MQKLSNITGKLLWKKFLKKQAGIIPFAYNPTFFDFYKNHFNWKPYYIIFTSKNEPCCILPIINTAKAWVSLPHFSHGGLLFLDGEISIKTSSLLHSAINMLVGESPGFFTINIDGISKAKVNKSYNYFIRTSINKNINEFVKTEKVVSYIKLPLDLNMLWLQLSNNLRRKINKAKKELVIKTGNEELLTDFYSTYVDNISHLGSLTYGLDFFRDLISYSKENNDTLFVAYYKGKPIGGALLSSYGNYFENLYFATKKEFSNTYVSDFLHWEMIVYSINKMKGNVDEFNSDPVYSFGRSTINSGVYNYKNHWPVENQELYNFTNISDIRKNKKLLKIWKHLPQFITNPLGAKLIKHIY